MDLEEIKKILLKKTLIKDEWRSENKKKGLRQDENSKL